MLEQKNCLRRIFSMSILMKSLKKSDIEGNLIGE